MICAISSVVTFFGLSSAGAIVTDPIDLIFTLEDLSKNYDGQPLTPDSYELEGELINGHKVQVTYSGSQTNVGESNSDINVKVIDEDNRDVTRQYDIIVNPGTLTVEKNPISISLDDCEMVYNGQELVTDQFKINSGSLVDGHKIVPSVPTSNLVNVGDVISDEIEPIIYDAFGNNVTSNYDINFTIGDISIVERHLAIRPIGGSKTYDGTPLGVSSYEIIGGSLVDGQVLDVQYKALEGGAYPRTDAGKTKVGIQSVEIKEWSEENNRWVFVTDNYSISYDEVCYVEVLKKDLTLATKSITKEYDGEAASLPYEYLYAAGLLENDVIESFEYQGYDSNDLPSLTDVGIMDVCIDASSVEMNDGKEGNYNISVIPGTIEIRKAYKDIIIAKQDDVVYNGEFYNFSLEQLVTGYENLSDDIKTAISAPVDMFKNAGTYTLYVNVTNCKNYELNVITNTFTIEKKAETVSIKDDLEPIEKEKIYSLQLEDVIKEQNLDQEVLDALSLTPLPLSDRKYQLNITVGSLPNYNLTINNGTIDILGTDKYTLILKDQTKEYDGLPYDGNIEKIIENYSSLPLEIKNNITLNDTSSFINVGTYELTIDYSNVPDYEITVSPAVLTINKKNEKIYVEDVVFEYGETIDLELIDVVKNYSDYSEEVINLLSIPSINHTNVGVYDLTLHVKNSNNYDIDIVPGKLTITKKDVIVYLRVPESLRNCEYDGVNHTYSVSDVVSNYDSLDSEVKSLLSVPANQNNIDANKYTIEIIANSSSNSNYNVIVDNGRGGDTLTFTITPRVINVTLLTKSFIYTGEEISFPADAYTTDKVFVGDDKFNVNYEYGTINKKAPVNVGEYEITKAEFIPINAQAKNYSFKVINKGLLIINPKNIDVIVNGYNTVYSNKDVIINPTDVIVNYNNLPSNVQDVISAKLTNYNTHYVEAGRYDLNLYELLMFEDYGNYSVSLTNSIVNITIEKKDVEVTLRTPEDVTYDGKYHSIELNELVDNTEYDEIYGLLSVKDVKYINAGTYDVSVNVAFTKNYNITVIPTTFTINKAEVDLSYDKKTTFNKYYDGKEFKLSPQDLTGNLCENHSISNIIHNSIVSSEDSSTIKIYYVQIIDENKNDVTNNYVLSYPTNGKVSIESITIELEMPSLTINYLPEMGSDYYLLSYIYDNYKDYINRSIKISSSTPLVAGDAVEFSDSYLFDIDSIDGNVIRVELLADELSIIGPGSSDYLTENTYGYIILNKYDVNITLKSFNNFVYSDYDYGIDLGNKSVKELVSNYDVLPKEVRDELNIGDFVFEDMTDAGSYSYYIDLNDYDFDLYNVTVTAGTVHVAKKQLTVNLREYHFTYNGSNWYDYLDYNYYDAILLSNQYSEVKDALDISPDFDYEMIEKNIYYYSLIVKDTSIYDNYDLTINVGKVTVS